ncbi:hypothetical protein [Nitrosomonas sp. Nm34]|nr:hypothetical protein [Nitrosomonas sp. Nm34]
MPNKSLQRTPLCLANLALGAALAHLFELPNKMTLSREDYLTAQYRSND